MSAVKAVRELKGSEEWTSGEGIAAAAGLDICVATSEQQDEGTCDWWAARATAVRAWMDANPLRLGIPGDGSLATIQAQLERGNEFEAARRRCWAHIEMELKELPGWDVEQSKPDGTFFKPRELAKMEPPPPIPAETARVDSGSAARPSLADFPPPSPEVFQPQEPGAAAFIPEAFGPPLPASSEAEEPAEAPADEVQVSAAPAPAEAPPAEATPAEAPAEETRKPLSQMTMLERQKYWMDKKKQKVEAERLEKEKEKENFSFKPNTASSKRTYKPMEPKPTPPMAHVPNAPVSGQSSEKTTATASKSKAGSRWQKVKSNIKDIKGSAPKRKAASKPKAADAVPGKAEKSELPPEPRTRLSARRQGEAEAAAGEERPETDTDPAPANAVVADATESGDVQASTGAGEELQVGQQGDPAEPAVPFVPGQFWYKIEAGRGYHRVQDGAGCQMWSMYRRKDKSRNLSGVSLLVGRLENPPYDEQVIQMIFDTDHWTEEEAFAWWGENEYRYTSCSDSGKLMVAPLRRNPPATKPSDLGSAAAMLKA